MPGCSPCPWLAQSGGHAGLLQPARWASRSRRLPVVCPHAQRWEHASSWSHIPSPHCHPTTPVATGAAHPPTCMPLRPLLHETGEEAHEAWVWTLFLRCLCPLLIALLFAGGWGNMASTHFLCVASCSHIAGRGCEHDPCAVLRARPLHAPPFACHPVYADASAAPEWWGTGVVHVEHTRGHAHMQCGRGIHFPLVPPSLHGSGSAPPHCTCTGWAKGGGRAGPCGMPIREWREGCLPRWLRACSDPGSPSKCPLVLARMARGRGLCHTLTFLCPVGVRMRPLLHKRGRD